MQIDHAEVACQGVDMAFTFTAVERELQDSEGLRLLKRYLAENGLDWREFWRGIGGSPTMGERLFHGREAPVSYAMATRIEQATHGAVPIGAWPSGSWTT